MNLKKIFQYIISLGLAAGLVWFTFKDTNIDLNSLWQKFKTADLKWLFLAGVTTIIAGWSRAYRWVMMLEPLGYRPSVFRATMAVFVGYFANIFIPRAGEFARCGSLQQSDNVPFEKSFGAVVAERVIDVLTLLFLILLNFILEFNRLKDFFMDLFGDKFKNPTTLIILGIGSILGLIIAIFLFKKYQQKISQIALYQRIAGFIEGIWSGFTSIQKLKNPMTFLFHTILIWTMYYLGAYLLFFCFPQTSGLSPLAGLTVLVAGAMGMAAPTQGGIGAYHLLVGKIIVLYGLDNDTGIMLATFLHAAQNYLFSPIFGLFALIVLRLKK
jgi:glycosyltransferase 2 family protein